MIGDDHVDVPGQDGLPEELLVLLVSDGRTALVLGGPGRDVAGGEVEVVVAGLHGQWETLSSGGSDEWQGGGGREVDDVTGNPSVAAHLDHQLDQRVGYLKGSQNFPKRSFKHSQNFPNTKPM